MSFVLESYQNYKRNIARLGYNKQQQKQILESFRKSAILLDLHDFEYTLKKELAEL
jgi:hypothetical protein